MTSIFIQHPIYDIHIPDTIDVYYPCFWYIIRISDSLPLTLFWPKDTQLLLGLGLLQITLTSK